MSQMNQHAIGWIGIGRMGYAMAQLLAKAGCNLTVWNRTRSKAEPLEEYGAKIADKLTDLASCDIVETLLGPGYTDQELSQIPN